MITNEQKQAMLSGILGDGCLTPTGAMNFNCSHKEYMIFKKQLLGDMCKTEVVKRYLGGNHFGYISKMVTSVEMA